SVGTGEVGWGLTGIDASVTVETLVEGNSLGGTFTLGFGGAWTQGLGVDASADEVKDALLGLPGVVSVSVLRSDPGLPVDRCTDGLCREGGNRAEEEGVGGRGGTGPTPGGGRVWSIELGTREGNIEYLSPTATEALQEGDVEWPTVEGAGLEGLGAGVELKQGFGASMEGLLQGFNVTREFSFALGGAGGSYGGLGGAGVTSGPEHGTPRTTYSDPSISELLGGSGGARGGISPAAIYALGETHQGRGGAGGGAIELTALNDVIIGSEGEVLMDGGAGAGDWEGGGGGGSGGAVVIAAGGTIRVAGTISVRGGDGGPAFRPLSQNAGGGGGGGRVALFAQSVDLEGASVNVSGGRCFVTTKSDTLRDDACPAGHAGASGTLYTDASFGYQFRADNNEGLGGAGAEGTNSSILVWREESGLRGSSGTRSYEALRPYDGPEYRLSRESSSMSAPERVTFYIKVVGSWVSPSLGTGGIKQTSRCCSRKDPEPDRGSEWGAIFALHSPGNASESSTNTSTSWSASPLLNASTSYIDNAQVSSPTLFSAPNTTMLGVGIIGGEMRYGTNYRHLPGDPHGNEDAEGGVLEEHIVGGRWYKVDIMLSWHSNSTSGVYRILVDGVSRVDGRRFWAPGRGLDRVGMYVLREGKAWFDEVYIGPDFTIGFRCPMTTRRGVRVPTEEATGKASGGPGWDTSKMDVTSKINVMSRHNSFVSQREQYGDDHGGLVPLDGDGMLSYAVDRYVRDDPEIPHEGGLKAGSLLRVPRGEDFIGLEGLSQAYQKVPGKDRLWNSGASRDQETASTQGTIYWYEAHSVDGYLDPALSGGVGACSTNDLKTWRFEGIVLHYANLTDMVQGTVDEEGGMVARQPKTGQKRFSLYVTCVPSSAGRKRNFTGGDGYVMWMGASDANGTLGMSAVSTSDYPDGPFHVRRTFYPDGNETRDQTVFIGSDGAGYLARTYFSEVEYIMPEAVMQPIWNSVHNRDGSVNYGLNYHRAFYHPDYDNHHDIYLERWRLEDLPWHVVCVNRITRENRTVEYGGFNEDGGYCNQPEEYKAGPSPFLGQGYPVVSSRFQDPTDSNNSFWMPDSVPAVKAQPWSANYRDGICGIREVDDGYEWDDPALDNRSVEDRSNCSNIADNPIHDTPPDKLIGEQRVVETRLAKFVAVSRLTGDLLDTSTVLMSFEGKLEGSEDLLALFHQGHNLFDWSAGSSIGYTYHPQVYSGFEMEPDWQTRLHQYEEMPNDRATYSVACVVDGSCPVNFKDQIEDSQ
ncbi:unnamed protein product, partial [Discosporangium mesarthrocarpum]